MRVQTAVLSTLALLSPLGTVGCSSTSGCDSPSEKFNLDESLTRADVQTIADSMPGVALTCEAVCTGTYWKVRRWQQANVSTCQLTLPDEAKGIEGRVTCSGTGYEYVCEGRRPLGHIEAGDEDCADMLGRNLAAMAYLEAASVIAFEQLVAWLEAQQAPSELVERCVAAAEDERHHARLLTQLAAERGAKVPTASSASTANDAGVLEVALHNAVEGCVHEGFSALMAAVRAERASESRVRRVFATLAADEIRHAQLAWDMHDWLVTRLEPAEARMVEQHRRQALSRLPERARELQARMAQALGYLASDEAERLASTFATLLAA
jgi:hypothetical protein